MVGPGLLQPVLHLIVEPGAVANEDRGDDGRRAPLQRRPLAIARRRRARRRPSAHRPVDPRATTSTSTALFTVPTSAVPAHLKRPLEVGNARIEISRRPAEPDGVRISGRRATRASFLEPSKADDRGENATTDVTKRGRWPPGARMRSTLMLRDTPAAPGVRVGSQLAFDKSQTRTDCRARGTAERRRPRHAQCWCEFVERQTEGREPRALPGVRREERAARREANRDAGEPRRTFPPEGDHRTGGGAAITP